ncbi:MAG: histidine phosphatase family protein [Acidimicrobiia bacterium]
MIAFVRHGETATNRAGRLLGRADPPLTETGRAQASALGTGFAAGSPPIAVLTSPLRRAVETATAIAEPFGLEIEHDERLIEIDYGEWDERGFDDVPADEMRRWRADPSFAPPGGESLTSVLARAGTCAEALLERAGDGLVVAVSHVSPIKAAVAWALGVGPEIAWRMRLDLASITRIGPGPSILSFNETRFARD